MDTASSEKEPGAEGRTKRLTLGGSRLRPLSWRTVVVAAIGVLLLAIAAAVASRGLPERATEGGPAPIDISDPRIGEFIAWTLIVLAIAIVVFTFWPTDIRPRRPQRKPLSLRRLLLGMAVVVFIMLAMDPILPEQDTDAEPEAVVAVEDAGDSQGGTGWTLVLLAGALGAALGGIAVLGRRSIGRARGDGAETGWVPDAAAEPESDESAAIERWLSEIDVAEPNRAAVVRTYGEMLRSLADSGHGRRASEAPEEYLRRIEHRASAGGAARRLTGLFEIAGFSDRETTDAMVTEADAALDAVRHDLRRGGA